jgi:hypothetical protein
VSAIIRENSEGVLLNYGDTADRAVQQKACSPDRQRQILIKAERGLAVINTVLECLEIDDVDRLWRAVKAIDAALQAHRATLT